MAAMTDRLQARQHFQEFEAKLQEVSDFKILETALPTILRTASDVCGYIATLTQKPCCQMVLHKQDLDPAFILLDLTKETTKNDI